MVVDGAYDRHMTLGYFIQPLTVDTWEAFAGLVERHTPSCASRFTLPERSK